MSKKWGTPTWVLLHSIAEQIKENEYINNKDKLLNQLKQICGVLPCPECKEHAQKFIAPYNVNHLPTKQHFKELIWRFHNLVNQNTRKEQVGIDILSSYSKLNIGILIQVFRTEILRPIHNNQHAESMYRNRVVNNFITFLYNNRGIFN